jgi:hypothetical protein
VNVKFIDSWGCVWETCGAEDEGAEAFGPRGCARPSSLHGFGSIAEARDAGQRFTDEEVDLLSEWMS